MSAVDWDLFWILSLPCLFSAIVFAISLLSWEGASALTLSCAVLPTATSVAKFCWLEKRSSCLIIFTTKTMLSKAQVKRHLVTTANPTIRRAYSETIPLNQFQISLFWLHKYVKLSSERWCKRPKTKYGIRKAQQKQCLPSLCRLDLSHSFPFLRNGVSIKPCTWSLPFQATRVLRIFELTCLDAYLGKARHGRRD